MATTFEAPRTGHLERLALRLEEAAASIGISKAKFYQLMKDGEIPFFMIGGDRRISPDALRAYRDRMVAQAESATPATVLA